MGQYVSGHVVPGQDDFSVNLLNLHLYIYFEGLGQTYSNSSPSVSKLPNKAKSLIHPINFIILFLYVAFYPGIFKNNFLISLFCVIASVELQ